MKRVGVAAIAGGLLAGVAATGAFAGQRGGPHLAARPGTPSHSSPEGLSHLTIDPNRDALLYVPPAAKAGAPLPFILLLHGATMRPESQINLFQATAEAKGIVLLSVKSADYTWDAIRGPYGRDIAYIDSALKEVFSSVRIDPARVAVEGFSDGASYALALALSNGDLFPRAIIFSAGFVPPVDPRGKPRFFMSHGTADRILPIDRAGRPIVAELRSGGYDVAYREFGGGHTAPRDVVAAAVDWLLVAAPS